MRPSSYRFATFLAAASAPATACLASPTGRTIDEFNIKRRRPCRWRRPTFTAAFELSATAVPSFPIAPRDPSRPMADQLLLPPVPRRFTRLNPHPPPPTPYPCQSCLGFFLTEFTGFQKVFSLFQGSIQSCYRVIPGFNSLYTASTRVCVGFIAEMATRKKLGPVPYRCGPDC